MGVIFARAVNNDKTTNQSANVNKEEKEDNSNLSTPVLKLRTISSKNNSEMLSTNFKLSDPEWDVHFSCLGLVNVTAVFNNINSKNSFTLIVKVCGKKLICNYLGQNQNQNKKLIKSLGTIPIYDAGMLIITAKFSESDGTDISNLKYIKLSGPGVVGARNLCAAGHRIVAIWSLIDTCHYFYSRVKVCNTLDSDTLFSMCWFYCTQIGLRDTYGKKSIWFNVYQTKSISDEFDFQMTQFCKNITKSHSITDDYFIYEYSLPFAWELNVNYHVLIRCNIINEKQEFVIYFYFDEELKWKKLAVLKVLNKVLNCSPNFASFIEDKTKHKNVVNGCRKAKFGPCWYKNGDEWKQVNQVCIQDNKIVPEANAIADENKVCLVIEEPAVKGKYNCAFSLKVKEKLPLVLQSLPE